MSLSSKLLNPIHLLSLWLATFAQTTWSADVSSDICRSAFERLGTEKPAMDPPSTPQLDQLREYLSSPSGSQTRHRLMDTPNGPTLFIQYLSRRHKRFMGLVVRAIEEESLAKIDSGLIIGPKALTSVIALSKKLERSGKRITIIGQFNPEDLSRTATQQQAKSLRWNLDPHHTVHWTKTEAQDFDLALKEFEQAGCARKAILCSFTLNIENGKTILKTAIYPASRKLPSIRSGYSGEGPKEKSFRP